MWCMNMKDLMYLFWLLIRVFFQIVTRQSVLISYKPTSVKSYFFWCADFYFMARRYGPPTRTDYRLIVENLSSRVSWQVRTTTKYQLYYGIFFSFLFKICGNYIFLKMIRCSCNFRLNFYTFVNFFILFEWVSVRFNKFERSLNMLLKMGNEPTEDVFFFILHSEKFCTSWRLISILESIALRGI